MTNTSIDVSPEAVAAEIQSLIAAGIEWGADPALERRNIAEIVANFAHDVIAARDRAEAERDEARQVIRQDEDRKRRLCDERDEFIVKLGEMRAKRDAALVELAETKTKLEDALDDHPSEEALREALDAEALKWRKAEDGRIAALAELAKLKAEGGVEANQQRAARRDADRPLGSIVVLEC